MSGLPLKTLVDVLQRSLGSAPKGSGRVGSIAWASTRGLVRSENQDRLVIAQARNGLMVAVLADGMGGMKEGALAATLATSAAAAYCIAFAGKSNVAQILVEALTFANEEVFRMLHGEGGAAVVLAAWTPRERFVAHAGDARAYHLSADGELRQLTVDDTVRGQLLTLGRASNESSAFHSRLLQFIGVGKDLEPHVMKVPEGGRGLLLASDGIHCLPQVIMEWVLGSSGHLQAAAERLATASEWKGGLDNGTAIVIGLQHGHAPIQSSAEFWPPNGHLAILASENPVKEADPRLENVDRKFRRLFPTSEPAHAVEDPPIRKKRSKKLRISERSASPQSQPLPIVTFGEPDEATREASSSSLITERQARKKKKTSRSKQ